MIDIRPYGVGTLGGIVLAIVGAGLILGSSVYGHSTPSIEKVATHSEDCMNCTDCSDGVSHYDTHPGLEQGEIQGGTFVNLCRIAYSVCPGAFHEPCSGEVHEHEELALSSTNVDLLEASLKGEAAEARWTVERFDWAELNEATGSVEVRRCDGLLFANFPARVLVQ